MIPNIVATNYNNQLGLKKSKFETSKPSTTIVEKIIKFLRKYSVCLYDKIK